METSDDPDLKESKRLKFIATTTSARAAVTDANKELQGLMKAPISPVRKKINLLPIRLFARLYPQ